MEKIRKYKQIDAMLWEKLEYILYQKFDCASDSKLIFSSNITNMETLLLEELEK